MGSLLKVKRVSGYMMVLCDDMECKRVFLQVVSSSNLIWFETHVDG